MQVFSPAEAHSKRKLIEWRRGLRGRASREP